MCPQKNLKKDIASIIPIEGNKAFSFEKSNLKYEIDTFVETVGLTFIQKHNCLKLSQIRVFSFVLYISYNYIFSCF